MPRLLAILLSLVVSTTPALAKKFHTPPPPPQYEYPFEGKIDVSLGTFDSSAHITVGGTTYSSYCNYTSYSVECSDTAPSDYWTITLNINNSPTVIRCCTVAKEIKRELERQGYVSNSWRPGELHDIDIARKGGETFHYRLTESGNATWPLAFCVPPKKGNYSVQLLIRDNMIIGWGTDVCESHVCHRKDKIVSSYYTETCFYVK
jgi:hypothetical protein